MYLIYKHITEEPECNKPNESLQCVKACPPERTCQNRNVFYRCASNINEVRENKCVCNDGFNRNPDSVCSTSDLCERCSQHSKNGEDQWDSGTSADCFLFERYLYRWVSSTFSKTINDNTEQNDIIAIPAETVCSTIKGEIVLPVLVENPSPCGDQYCPVNKKAVKNACPASISSDNELPQRCECRFNYSRAKNGTCIPTSQCPPFPCGPNEMFVACPPYCPTDDCSPATSSGKCPKFGRIGIVVSCRPQCRCIENYCRKNNVCVPSEQSKNSNRLENMSEIRV
ncbi:unnamed protein product [Parnassius apollo]|uniref:(apollo) hypothetical protein n=1 Tax=Parnassius apollo TaxID=110799 RepID=A0A8S3WFY4_PARAO|nr:unnamed protein product [Parnassius apollo]